MASGLQKALITLICINILLYTSGFRVYTPVTNDNKAIMDRFVTQDTNGQYTTSSDIQSKLPNDNKGLFNNALGFIDGLGTIGDLIIFIINIVFTPLSLFTGMGLPSDLVLMIGMPLMIMLFLGMAYFIRSGQ